jgi:micrococcal nuclease
MQPSERAHRRIPVLPFILAGVGVLTLLFILMGCRALPADSEATSDAPASSAPTTPPPDTTFRVWKVTDGDTVHVVPSSAPPDAKAPDLTVRIIGINTPEVYGPKAGECGGYGKVASKLAKDAMLGRTVTLTTDPTQDETDRFGRALRYVDVVDTDHPLPAHDAFGNPPTDYSTYATVTGAAFKFEYDGVPGQRAPGIREAEAQAAASNLGVHSACPAP